MDPHYNVHAQEAHRLAEEERANQAQQTAATQQLQASMRGMYKLLDIDALDAEEDAQPDAAESLVHLQTSQSINQSDFTSMFPI